MDIHQIKKQVSEENLKFMINDLDKKLMNANFFEKLLGDAIKTIFERIPKYQEEIYGENPEMKEFFEKEYDFYFSKLTEKQDVIKWMNIYGTPKNKNKELYSLLSKKKYFEKLDIPAYEEDMQIMKLCFLALDNLSEKNKADLQETLFLFSQAVKQMIVPEMFTAINGELVKNPEILKMVDEMEKAFVHFSKDEKQRIFDEMAEEFAGLIHAGKGLVAKELNELMFKSKVFNIEKGINLDQISANKI